MKHDIRKTLSDNVLKIMTHRYGKEHISKMSAETSLALATFTRIKDGHTYVTLHVVEELAEKLGYEAWALLVPSFDPADPPMTAMSRTQTKANAQMLEAIATLVK